MIITLSEQTSIFLCACLLGALLSFAYDIFRIIRMIGSRSKALAVICDLIFFLGSAVITYLYLLQRCYGQVRIFVLIGETVGFFLCHFTLSPYIVRFAAWVGRGIRHVVCFLISPFVKLFRFFGEKAQKRRGKRKINREKHKKIPQKALQPHKNVMYNLLIKVLPKRRRCAHEKAEN